MKDKLFILCCAGAGVLSVTAIQAKEKPRNVLFILVDDYGWNDTSCGGSDFYDTPNIDRIARQGVMFTQGYAACQVSSPSRASIMTGKSPARHGITNWIGEASGEAWRKMGSFQTSAGRVCMEDVSG